MTKKGECVRCKRALTIIVLTLLAVTVGLLMYGIYGKKSEPKACRYEHVECIQAPCDPVLVCS